MVMGTSSCHMLNSRVEQLVPGVAGVVQGGILPVTSDTKRDKRPSVMLSIGCVA